jgi:replication factor A1
LANLVSLRKPFGSEAISANTPAMSLEEGKAEAQRTGSAVYFRIRGTVVMMKHDENQSLYYLACPAEGCGKKVTQSGDGWLCERCNQTYPVMNPRYILSLVISDYSGRYVLAPVLF